MKFRSGYKVVKTLRKYVNGKPTNITKANVSGQDDYIEKYLSDDCPVNNLPNGITQTIVNPSTEATLFPTTSQSNTESYTLSFSEYINGWTSFHSWKPESMISSNGEFYTFKNGHLYKHHANETLRNTFYGQEYNSEIEFVANDSPSDIKMFRTVKTEGNSKNWDITVESESEKGFVDKASFKEKEGMYYGYVRNNNTEVDYKKLSVQGLGLCASSTTTTVTINNLNVELMSVGDKLYKAAMSSGTGYTSGDTIGTPSLLGTITSISGNVITHDGSTAATAGNFILFAKNQTAESEGIRGYHAKIKLTNDSTSPVELFAVDSEVTKSNL